MTLRTFRNLDELRASPFDLPSTLLESAENREARGEAWQAHHCQRGGQEIWTLVLADEGAALQWRDRERFMGEWVQARQAIRLEESLEWGLYNLEGRRIPQDPFDDEDEEGGSYSPAFGPPTGGVDI